MYDTRFLLHVHCILCIYSTCTLVSLPRPPRAQRTTILYLRMRYLRAPAFLRGGVVLRIAVRGVGEVAEQEISWSLAS